MSFPPALRQVARLAQNAAEKSSTFGPVIPLREALQVLIGEGLVKASTNRGVRAGRAIERDIARRLRLLVSKLEIPAYLYDPA